MIRLYDSEDTFFYCDPPYIHSTRGDSKAYGYEMTDQQHIEFANVLNQAKGKVALSNYYCPLMEKLYPSSKWGKIFAPIKQINSTHDVRQEVLWVNYQTDSKNNQISLF